MQPSKKPQNFYSTKEFLTMTKDEAWDKLVTIWNCRKASKIFPLVIVGYEARAAGIGEEQIEEFIQEGRMRKCRLLNDYGLLIYKQINK